MAECLIPFHKKDTGELFPCGKCYNCLMRRSSGWSFRLMQQEKQVMSAYFVTLTYDNAHVKFTPKNYMTLCKRDVQLFIKSLRFAQFGSKKSDIKYYLCGEYGGQTFRPHYHIILFNADLSLLIGERDAKFTDMGVLKLDGKVPYKSVLWEHGSLTVGTVSDASVGYTLKYMHKPFRIPQHENDDRFREFSCMSKGLGLSYLTPAMVEWHKASLLDRMYLPLGDGKKCAMPRYYKLKMYTDQERRDIARHIEQLPREETTLSRKDLIRLSNLKLKQSSTKNRNL